MTFLWKGRRDFLLTSYAKTVPIPLDLGGMAMMGASDLIWELVRTALALDNISEKELTGLLTRAIGLIQDIRPFESSPDDAIRAELITLLTSPKTVVTLPRDLIQIYLLEAANIISEGLKNDQPADAVWWDLPRATLH